MSSEYSLLSEVADVIDSLHKTPKYSLNGRSMVRVTDVKYGPLNLDATKKVHDKVFEEFSKRYTPAIGDIIITRVGSYGITSYVVNPNFCLGQNTAAITPKVNSRYLYFVLNSQQLKNQIESSTVGSTQKTLSLKAISNLEIPRLSLDEEDRVANILGQLDDKIELNTRLNNTLEQMAQAMFKSWFVDFEPVKAKIAALEAGGTKEDALIAAMQAISGKDKAQLARFRAEQSEQYNELRTTAELFPSSMQDSELGEIPEGWNVTAVNEIAEIVKGKSYKSVELDSSQTALVTLKSFKRGGGYRLDGLKEYTGKYKPKQEVLAGDLIIAYTDVTQAADVIGKPAMVIGDKRYEHLVISLDVAVVRPIDTTLKSYLYGLAKTDAFQFHTKAHTTGTTVLHLAKNAVPGYQFVLPPKDLVIAYADLADPLFTLINEKVQESRSLESLRDTLLPKFLSGELAVSNIEGRLPVKAETTDV